MLKSLLPIFAILVSVFTYGQDTYSFRLEPDSVRNCLYSSLKVIDLRNNKESIGYVCIGGFNTRKTVTTEKTLEDCLALHFSKLMKSSAPQQLILVLHELMIEDRPGGDEEIGTIHFTMDFFTASGDKYAFVGNVDTLFEVNGKMDITSKLDKAAQYVLTETIMQYAQQEARNLPLFTETEMKNRRDAELKRYAVYKAESYRNGIYRTSRDFINNSMLDTPIAMRFVSNGSSAYRAFYYADADGDKGPRIHEDDYFAIYYDNEWYVPHSGSATKMQQRNGEFYATKSFRGLKGVSDKRTLAAGIGFGLVGGLAFGLIGELVYISSNIVGSDDRKKQKVKTCNYEARFDPVQGKFKPVRRVM